MKLAHALLREHDWLLGPGESVMDGYREETAFDDMFEVEVQHVA